ncbi:MAG: ATP-binding protein [Solirubrobacterales bacterium]
MIAFAAIVLGAALALGFTATAAVMRLRTIRARAIGALLVTALLPLIAVVASGLVMFESEHDLVVLSIVVGSTLVALGAAILLLRGITAPLDLLTGTAHEIASGDLAARATPTGVAETDELAESFNAMADYVESLFDARRQLVAWASHDLRTPLAAMQAMLEAIEDGISTPEEYLPAINDQVARLSQLVADLFELAMIDAAALTLELDEVRVGDLISACVNGFEGQAHAGGVRLTTHVADPEATVRCAPDKIERVIMNLLTNALRHTPGDGAVAISAESIGTVDGASRAGTGDLLIHVTDSGSGLSSEESERAFDHFFRGDDARETSGGAGLGLAIAKGLVEAHGGEIWAENCPEGGASFSFTLPAKAAS